MADDRRNAQVVLTADNSQYDQSMQRSAASTDQVTNSVVRLLDSVNKLTASAGRKVIGIGAAEVAGLAAAVTQASKLQEQLSQLQASSIITGRNFTRMTQDVDSLRRSTALSTDAVVGLVKQLNSMGQGGQNVKSLVDTFTRLGAITGESIDGLVQGLVSLQRQMGTEGAQNTKRYASALADLSQQAGVSATGVLQFANAIAPVAKVAGVSQTAILGISTAFSKAGQDGYSAANAFNTLLTNITRSIQYGSPDLQSYANLIGVTVDQLKNMPKGDVVGRFFSEINKQGPEAIKTLEQFGLDGIRTYKAIQATAASGGIQGAIDMANKGMTDTTKFTEASDKALDGLQENLRKTGNILQEVGESFGKGLIDPLSQVTKSINAVLSPMAQLMQFLGNIPGAAAAGVAGLTLLGGALLRGFGALTGIGTIATLTRGFGMAGFRSGRGASRLTDRGYAGRMQEDSDDRANAFQRGLYRTGEYLGGAMGPRAEGQGRFSRGANFAGSLVSRGLGSFMRAGLEPLYPENLINPANRQTLLDTIGGREKPRLRDRLTGWALGGDVDKQSKAFGESLKTNVREMSRSGAAFKNVTAEAAKLALALGKAGTGAVAIGGMGAGRLAARGAAGLASSALGMVGGVGGLALLGGGYAFSQWQDRNNTLDDIAHNQEDTSALGTYKSALGEAATATMSFAQAAKNAADKVQSTTGQQMTRQQAITLSPSDLSTAMGASGKYTDSRVATMSESQAKSFASVALANATPQEARLLALDFGKRFGARANGILSDAAGMRPDVGGLFGQITSNGSAGGFLGDQTGVTSASNLASGSLKQFIAGSKDQSAASLGGIAGAINAYVNGQADIASSNVRGGNASSTTQAAISDALTNAILGDSASDTDRKAFRAALDKVSTGDYSYGVKDANTAQFTGGGGRIATFLQTLEDQGDTGARGPAGQLMNYYMSKGLNGNPFDLTNSSVFSSNPFQPNVEDAVKARLQSSTLGQSATSYDSGTGRTLDYALQNNGNPFAVQAGVNSLVTNAQSLSTSYTGQIQALQQFKQQIGDAANPLSQLADSAEQAVRGLQMQGRMYQDSGTTAFNTSSQFQSDVAAIRSGDTSEATLKNAQADGQDLKNQIQSAYSQFQQIVVAKRNYDIQLRQGEQDYDTSRIRSQFDFSLQRQRSEDSFNRGRARAQRDYGIQLRESWYQFSLSRQRSEEDYQHQVQQMALQTAKTMTDVYNRVTVQQTASTGTILTNMRDQQERLNQQQQQLGQLRGMGLSDTAIDQLGLNDPAKQQQLARFFDDVTNNPQLIKSFNDAISKRVQTATKVVTDESSNQWQEMQYQFQKQQSRSSDDFAHGLAVNEQNFNRSLNDQRVDYGISMSQANEDFNRGMSRMASDHDLMLQRMRDNFSLAYEQITGDFNTMGTKAVSSLTGAAKQQAQALLNILGPMVSDIDNMLLSLGYQPATPVVGAQQTQQGYNNKMAGQDKAQGFADGGAIKGYSPHPKADNIMIRATAGEYVQPVDVVQHYGVKFMDALREKRLPMDGGGFADGGLVGGTGSTSRVPIDGQVVDPKTYAIINAAERLIGTQLQVTQGSWSTRVAASGSTHAGAGASDMVPLNGAWDQAVGALRGKGGIAWHRLPSQGPWIQHIHMITPGVPGLSSSAQSQVQQYLHGGDGLGGKDPGPPVNMAGLPPEVIAMMSASAGGSSTTPEQLKAMIGSLATVKKFGEIIKKTPGLGQRLPSDWLASKIAATYGQQLNSYSGGFSGTASAQANQKIAAGMLQTYGWGGDQMNSLIQLWNGESGWNQYAKNPSSGAYGIPQSLPANKMATTGGDYLTNPATQIKWGLQYIKQRYGTPSNAFNQWTARSPHWYAEGGMFSKPNIIGVGEQGPEAVVPLNQKGAGYLASVMGQMMNDESRKALVAGNGSVTKAATSTYYAQIDHSTTYSGDITVMASDPMEMERKLDARKRMKALTGAR